MASEPTERVQGATSREGGQEKGLSAEVSVTSTRHGSR